MGAISLTPAQRDEICRRYQEEDTSLRQLAREYPISYQKIHQMLVKRGIKRRRPGDLTWSRREYVNDRRRERAATMPCFIVLPPGSRPEARA